MFSDGRSVGLAVLLSSALLLAGEIRAGELALEQAEAAPGDTRLCLPVRLTRDPGEEVSGIQFNVRYDPASLRLEEIIAGDATTKASKDLYFNALSANEATAIIAGLNQGRIADGVIATCCFTVLDQASLRGQPVTLGTVVLSDPYGSRLAAQARSGSILRSGGTGAGPAGGNAGGASGATRWAVWDNPLARLLLLVGLFVGLCLGLTALLYRLNPRGKR